MYVQNSTSDKLRTFANTSRNRVRAGLSLLELLVVLTILIALGGIVVSTLPGMLKRTQVATAAANDTVMPWTRGKRRAAFIAKRKAEAPVRKSA